MDDILFKIIDLVMTNGQYTIVAVLILVIMFLYKTNSDMQKRIDKKDETLLSIFEKYYESVESMKQFMSEVRKVLTDFKNRL